MKKIEINKEEGLYICTLDGELKIPLTTRQQTAITSIIIEAVKKEVTLLEKKLSLLTNESQEGDKKESKAEKRKITPNEEMSERRKFIASLYKKKKTKSEIRRELMKKFPHRSEACLSFTLDDWYKKVGLTKKSEAFNKYLAEHDYKVEESELDNVAEKFHMSPQEIKRETFKIRSLIYV